MVSIFPDLLTFGIFGALIIRVAIGFFFLNLGWQHLKRDHSALAQEYSTRMGSFSEFFAWVIGIFEALVGITLIVGFLTQVAALFVIIFALKALWFKKTFPIFAPYEKTVYLFLIVMSLSLLLTGAGVPAIDLPL